MKKLDSKVAIVTGSGRGIGRSVALKLAGEGAAVVINDVDAEPAMAVVKEIQALGGAAVACLGSVSAEDFGERLVKTCMDNFGAIDIIVNNAGYSWDNVIQKTTDEQWYAIIDVHVTAPFRILRAAYPVFRDQHKADAEAGREVMRKVVNISSVAGLGGNAGQANYAAAKAGIVGLTKTMAKEWGRLKVNVNCVAFGLIETRLAVAAADNARINIEGHEIRVGVNTELMDSLRSTIPLGRLGRPDEAAGAVYLFCIPESDYISGQTVVCGGGVRI